MSSAASPMVAALNAAPDKWLGLHVVWHDICVVMHRQKECFQMIKVRMAG